MQPYPRRFLVRFLALFFAFALVAVACEPAAQPTPPPDATPTPADMTPAPDDGTPPPPAAAPIMLSTQLAPDAEADAMRNVILGDYPGGFPGENFVPATAGEFADRVAAEAALGEGGGQVSVLGGLHGDFSPLVEQGQLMDVSDLAAELADRGFIESYTELAHYGTDQQYFIPWMQATYILAARQEAMEYLPEGADQDALTWEQVTEWGRNISDAGHGARLGFPAGPDGLWHRFFQGFALPAWTGRVNTNFAGSRAEEMWTWLRDSWEFTNPQSTTYAFMQDPLQTAEVWIAWDHVARLRDAFVNDPGNYVAMPAPAGPEGRAFMPVVAGLAIPSSSPDVQAARDLIEYLTRPEVQANTLREVGFFPASRAELPADLDEGRQNMVDAVVNLTGAPDALPALLPVGLGEHGGAYNQVFRDTFEAIVIGGEDIRTVINRERDNLQEVLNTAGAACWPPDPPSDGPCEVLEGPPG